MGDHNIQRVILHGELLVGKQNVGRPVSGYRASLKRALKLFGVDPLNWNNFAMDKAEWRNIINKHGCCFYMKESLRVRNIRSDKRNKKRCEMIGMNNVECLTVSENETFINEEFDTRIDTITNFNNDQIYSEKEEDMISDEDSQD